MDRFNRLRLAIPSALGVLLFALYLHTAGPGLVPYRDAGEMATSVPLLGILHPTSYPFYSISGHLIARVLPGNLAYRMNVYSAIAMVVAWVFLFLLLSELTDRWSAASAVGLGAVSYQFWTHALVSEMYCLSLAFLAIVLWLIQRRKWLLAAFIFGLGMTNRSDLVLCLPAVVVLVSKSYGSPRRVPWWGLVAAGLTGLTLYFYLLIRAANQPLLNWDDPSTIGRFFRSLLRLGYGGTLDLLSQSYGTGENFLDELRLYGKHLFVDFAFVGVPLAMYGCVVLWRNQRTWFYAVAIGFLTTGPLFIFLGNLPINPHAVAIMEAAYLAPDLFILIAVAAGIQGLRLRLGNAASLVPVGCVVAGIAWLAVDGYAQTTKRNDFYAIDFVTNVYRTAPERAIIVGRSDVPLFSLFYGRWIHPATGDRVPVAQGLAGSPWYEEMIARQINDMNVMILKDDADWKLFSAYNKERPLLATNDIDWPNGSTQGFRPYGLLSTYETSFNRVIQPTPDFRLFYQRRGNYQYGGRRDFFIDELIEEYSKAALSQGEDDRIAGDWAHAEEEYRWALAFQPTLPYAAQHLGYSRFVHNDFHSALYYYRWANDRFKDLWEKAVAWRSGSGAQNSIRNDWAQSLAQTGVVEDHLNDDVAAKGFYDSALRIDPACADAQYNLAVLYWKQADWANAVQELQAMATSHPEDPRPKSYLPMALRHLHEHV